MRAGPVAGASSSYSHPSITVAHFTTKRAQRALHTCVPLLSSLKNTLGLGVLAVPLSGPEGRADS